jgi:hypothetical protein
MMVLKPWEMAIAKHSVMRCSNLQRGATTAEQAYVVLDIKVLINQAKQIIGHYIMTDMAHNAVASRFCMTQHVVCRAAHLLMMSRVNLLQGPPPRSL